MKIEFLACIQGTNCLSTDDEGCCKIRLTADGSQLPYTVKLNTVLKKLIKVTIEEVKS